MLNHIIKKEERKSVDTTHRQNAAKKQHKPTVTCLETIQMHLPQESVPENATEREIGLH